MLQDLLRVVDAAVFVHEEKPVLCFIQAAARALSSSIHSSFIQEKLLKLTHFFLFVKEMISIFRPILLLKV